MKRGLVICIIAASLALPRLCLAQSAAVSAPSLGDEKFTVHLAGMLGDVLQDLSKITKRQMNLQTGPGPDGAPGGNEKGLGKAGTPVTLDFDNAVLSEILAALCKQAGLVYEAQGQRYISLRDGDPDVDPRPTANLADYIVRVAGVTANSSRAFRLKWGSPVPDAPDLSDSLQLELAIIPKTPAADLALAGYDRNAKATTDKGGTLAAPEHGNQWGPPNSTLVPIQRYGGDEEFGGISAHIPPLMFVPPPAGVRALPRVEGSLLLYSNVQTTEFKVAAADEGKTLKQDDVTITLKSWKPPDAAEQLYQRMLRVNLEVQAPALPRKQNEQQWSSWDSQRLQAFVVGKDGKRRKGMCGSQGGNQNTRQYELIFRIAPIFFGGPAPADEPPFEPDYLLLTLIRTADPDKQVPFVLENVPVP